MHALMLQLVRSDTGATAIEYGLIAAHVAVVCIAARQLLGTNPNTEFTTIAGSCLREAMAPRPSKLSGSAPRPQATPGIVRRRSVTEAIVGRSDTHPVRPAMSPA
ncbi:MAG: Flp family type IVb pilin [Bradyrhizobium sp.]